MKFTAGMSLARFLVVFAVGLVFGHGNRCNNKTDVELYDPSDRSKFKCWPVPDCHDGQEPSVEPGSTHPQGTEVHCQPCHEGYFSNRETNNRCHKCTSCGKKVVHHTCTTFRDTQCKSRCISTDFYLNNTDDQCYPCTECCGHNSTNIESQCLSSVRIGTVIGVKGALHCKVLFSQQCDELPKNNDTSVLERKCNGTENNVNNFSSVLEEKCSWSWDTLHISVLCGLVFMALISAIQFWLCITKERKVRSSRNGYLPSSESFPCINKCLSSSAGHRCRLSGCDMVSLLDKIPFQEKLKLIPEEVRINSDIPYEVEEYIKKLDAKKPQSRNWYDVGRKLGYSKDDLNLIKREDYREDGSPTSSLLSKLSTEENVITLREFVQVLHDLRRHDIANPIIEIYKKQAATNVTNV